MMTPTAHAQRNKNRNRTTVLMLLFVLLLLVLGVVLLTCRSRKDAAAPPRRQAVAVPQGLEIPTLRAGEEMVAHTAYSLSYNEAHEQASWVAYPLRGYQVEGEDVERTDRFRPDPLVKTRTAGDADYNGSGYDRGHLASAEDMAWSAVTMQESFYYSNISPQVPAFNRGVWRRLEELVRYWATAYDSVYTAVGPVLTAGLPAIGRNGVSVPRQFYRVVLEYNPKGVRGIGFVLPNEASAATLRSFAVSIDSVERLTGLDFFPRLPDETEEKTESRLETNDWLWQRSKKKEF